MKAENNKILKEKKNWILLLFKKLAKLIFNRIFYVAVAMLVQLGWILMMVLRLAAYSRYIDIGLRLIGIVLVLWILNKEINPSYKLTWTMLILILPILGVVLYFVFGRSRIAAIMQQHFEQRIEESREYLRDRPQTRQKLEALDPSASNQSRYISDVSRFPVHENTTAEYFQVGDDMFPVLVRELKQAVTSAVLLTEGETVGADKLEEYPSLQTTPSFLLKDGNEEKERIIRALVQTGGNRETV